MAKPGNDLHPRLSIVFGLPEQTIWLGEGVCVAGSSPGSGVVLRHASVSARHCRFERKGSRCWIADLGSGPGSFVNGAPVTQKVELKPDDLVHLGSVSLRYCGGSAAGCRGHDPGMANGNGAAEVHALMSAGGRAIGKIRPGAAPVTIGRDPACDIVLASPVIAGRHARLETDSGGTRLIAINDHGDSLVNGQHFDEHRLIYGDQVDLGPFRFQFDGCSLELIEAGEGAALVAQDLTVEVARRRRLDQVSLSIRSNQFVGIIGPTGAGKTTLLRALTGLQRTRPGAVLLNGRDVRKERGRLSRIVGWVPQEDIVHRELTVRRALTFAARLRLSRDTPRAEIGRLVERTAARLGLSESLAVSIGKLSGGEVKKVSVGVELLCRPQVLFLDEPTSGLDPGAEARVMELLRHLSDAGCTVVCTTHTMQNLYLLDRLVVMSEGAVVFDGKSEEARTFFGVRDLAAMFDRLSERPPAEWRAAFDAGRADEPEPAVKKTPEALPSKTQRPAFQLPLLFARQCAIFASDWRNFLVLLLQPMLIGGLLAWAVEGTVDDSSLKLFFCSVAILWFGCSNGAQQIVGEMAIYRRERMVGLHRASYVFAKWLFVSLATLVQGGLLYGITRFAGAGITGAIGWQGGGLAAMAVLAAAFGLAISAIARTSMQAVVIVPLFIIPQIVLSGYTVAASAMKADVLAWSQAAPSFQLQRIMDTSVLWERKIDPATLEVHMPAFRNLNRNRALKLGDVYDDASGGGTAFAILGGWLLAAGIFTWGVLRFREREF